MTSNNIRRKISLTLQIEGQSAKVQLNKLANGGYTVSMYSGKEKVKVHPRVSAGKAVILAQDYLFASLFPIVDNE